jgi:hypothetical protein
MLLESHFNAALTDLEQAGLDPWLTRDIHVRASHIRFTAVRSITQPASSSEANWFLQGADQHTHLACHTAHIDHAPLSPVIQTTLARRLGTSGSSTWPSICAHVRAPLRAAQAVRGEV